MTARSLPAATGALLVLLLAGCSGAAHTEPTRSPPATADTTVETSSPAPVPAPEPTGEELTCESMISDGTVAALTSAGWSAQGKEFRAGGVEFTDGLLCFWADFSVPSDHGQLYGWARVSAADAAEAQAGLLAEGWQREESEEGVYVTEDPEFSMGTDEDGYGMTYLFGDGWVKFADTRQSLLLVDWAD